MATPGSIVATGKLVTPGGPTGPTGPTGPQGVPGDSSPVGAVTLWVTSTAPSGWLFCDGSLISRASFPTLFTLLGTTFGAGDGSTTFGLPDLRGRTGIGAGLGAGLSINRVLGVKGGEENHQLTIAELAAHTHTDAGHAHGLSVNQNWTTRLLAVAAGSESIAGFPSANNTANATATNQNTGSGTAHNNMQPYLVLYYIIKATLNGIA